MLIYAAKKVACLSVHVEDFKMTGKKASFKTHVEKAEEQKNQLELPTKYTWDGRSAKQKK